MKDNNNKRAFPRVTTQCPVLYRGDHHARWMVGIMLDMSATGLRMTCNEPLNMGTVIDIHYKPGKNKLVPEIKAMGKVVRSLPLEENKFEISCSLTKVQF